MATVNQIFVDSASNIVTKTKNILQEKDAEKKQKELEQIRFLKHEADICLEEIMFVEAIIPTDNRVMTYNQQINQCIKFAESAVSNSTDLGGISGILSDENFMNAYFAGIERSIREFKYEDYYRETRMWMLDPSVPYGEPHTMTEDADLIRIDHVTDQLVKIVSSAVKAKKHPMNVLLSRANYEPSAIQQMKDELGDNVRIYGMYDKQHYIHDMDLRMKMEKCCFGDASEYNIRNKVFDIAFQRFGGDRDYHREYISTPAAAESPVTKDLSRFWRYLAPGGILLYLMPGFLLRNKERKTIASKYQYLWSIRIQDKAFPAAGMELVALQKTERKDLENIYEAVTNRKPADALTDEMVEQAVAGLGSEDAGPVNLFNGPEDDLLIIQIALNSSTLKVRDDAAHQRTIEPLLPLKKGQIGQIIASGRLNGIIDEGNGCKHVISGRVIKGPIHRTVEQYDDPNHAIKEDITTDCNKIEITAIGGDGKLRELSIAG